MNTPTLPKQQAEAEGYRAITDAYLPHEQIMLNAAINQLGPIRHCLVQVETSDGPGLELWRK